MEEEQCCPAMARQTSVSSSSTSIKLAHDRGVGCRCCSASYRAAGVGFGGMFACMNVWRHPCNGHEAGGGQRGSVLPAGVTLRCNRRVGDGFHTSHDMRLRLAGVVWAGGG